MKKFFWWTDFQKKLADEVEAFIDEWFPYLHKKAWKKEVPWELIKEMKKRGYYGCLIPEKYGGIEEKAKITGACIIGEQVSRLGANAAAPFGATMFGGCHQLVGFGNEEQKERWLPGIARGDTIGAIVLTEPFVGSDAAGVQCTAVKEGDHYILNGVKRFISNVGIADIYMVYAKTSDKERKIAKHQHMSAFILEKGTHGFSVEKINELSGYRGVRNGYLRFNDVEIPAENMLGKEGGGWTIMFHGLNFERTLVAAMSLGGMDEGFRMTYYYTNRRVQFKQPTFYFETVKRRLGDIMIANTVSRILVYYAAHMFERGEQPIMEANAAKIFVTEMSEQVCLNAVMAMGGDACTLFYPVVDLLQDVQVNKVGAGTNDIARLLLARFADVFYKDTKKMPRRRYDEETGIGLFTYDHAQMKPVFDDCDTKTKIIKALAEDYRVNPGLYMTIDELKYDTEESDLDKALNELESDGLVAIIRGKKGAIKLVKATYEGQKKANPLEYYRWFPKWIKKDEIF